MGDERAQEPRDAANETRKRRPEPYPAADRTDGVHGETRSFSSQQPACDVTPVSVAEGRLGPGGDPAEGKDEP